jgi:hypothetical protein
MKLTAFQMQVLQTRMKAECIGLTLCYIAGAVVCRLFLEMSPGETLGTFICFAGATWNVYFAFNRKILRGGKLK